MLEAYFSLSHADQVSLLKTAAAHCGKAEHLLEKDVWLVWTLQTLFSSPFAEHLTFKGGTSLSKAYGAIDRFSEDVDMTYDMRCLIPELVGSDAHPSTASQAKKWTKAVRTALARWVHKQLVPLMTTALTEQNMQADLEIIGGYSDTLLLKYPQQRHGTGYVAPHIRVEFGARSTGEPHEKLAIACDLAEVMPDIIFPQTTPQVMKIERTFWEKATAVHVFCCQQRLRGDRFSRHWYDLVRLSGMQRVRTALDNKTYLADVARHKQIFFVEKDSDGVVIDYEECLHGNLHLVPQGQARKALQDDYHFMQKDGILPATAPNFDEIMEYCGQLQEDINMRLAG